MTFAEFLVELKNTKSIMDWDCQPGGLMRGFKPHGNGHLCFCPITAVLYTLEEQYLPSSSAIAAINKLGLDIRDGGYIVLAADGAERMVEIRKQLEDAILGGD